MSFLQTSVSHAFRMGTSSIMISVRQFSEQNNVHQNNEHLYFFCPRNCWRISSSLLWPGAHRSQLWGDEEGDLRRPAEAHSAQPTPFPPGKTFRCASACTRVNGPFGLHLPLCFHRFSQPLQRPWRSAGTRTHTPASRPCGWGRPSPNWNTTATSPSANWRRTFRPTYQDETETRGCQSGVFNESICCHEIILKSYEPESSLFCWFARKALLLLVFLTFSSFTICKTIFLMEVFFKCRFFQSSAAIYLIEQLIICSANIEL